MAWTPRVVCFGGRGDETWRGDGDGGANRGGGLGGKGCLVVVFGGLLLVFGSLGGEGGNVR